MRIGTALAISLTACATAKPPPWVPATSTFVAPAAGFEVSVPAGWMRRNLTNPDRLVATRDGTPLQRIVVRATEVGKPMGLGGSKRVVTEGMSPQELAELAIDDLQSSGATDVRILENAPATLDGRRGFRVVATFRAGNGLAMRLALHGLSLGNRFYSLVYSAPERHYFALDLATFDELVQSFRVRSPAPVPQS